MTFCHAAAAPRRASTLAIAAVIPATRAQPTASVQLIDRSAGLTGPSASETRDHSAVAALRPAQAVPAAATAASTFQSIFWFIVISSPSSVLASVDSSVTYPGRPDLTHGVIAVRFAEIGATIPPRLHLIKCTDICCRARSDREEPQLLKNLFKSAAVDVRTAHEMVDSATAVLVDVRTKPEWREGHAPRALHISLASLERQMRRIPEDKTVLAICRSGNRSVRAVAMLQRAGYEALNVKGGMGAWARSGLPVTRR